MRESVHARTHGWISSRRMWYDVVERMDEARFTMHLFDFRGCGLSDRPRDGHDLQGYFSELRWVVATIDAPVALVGHSVGGKLAQLAASYPRRPERASMEGTIDDAGHNLPIEMPAEVASRIAICTIGHSD